MRILHVDEQRGWRGGEQQAAWLIHGLAERGHAVHIAGRRGSAFLDPWNLDADIVRIALPFHSEFDLWTAYRMSRVIVREEIEIVHAHTSHAHLIACLARGFARRGKVVVSRRVSFAPGRNPFNRWKYSLPDCFISVSHAVDEVLRVYGITPARRAVVHSAVDLERLHVPPIERQALGIPEGVPLLFSAGALVPHKDHATLLAAFAEVRRRHPEARLLIAGEGELRPALEAEIAKRHLAGAAVLLGHRGDVPAILRAADVYVSSSWSEGLGTSILEALAAEVPVVATVAGGAAEMVKPGETGRLAPNRNPAALAEAIVQTLDNPAAARELAKKGRALIEARFSVGRMIDGTIRVYENLLGVDG